MKSLEKDCKNTLKFQETAYDIQKKLFVTSVAQIRAAVDESDRGCDEVIKNLLSKFLSNSGMLAHKESKLVQLEEKNK